MSDRYVIAFHPADEDAPTSVRTYTKDEAIHRAQRLNAIRDNIGWPGKWKVHNISDGTDPRATQEKDTST